MRLFQGYKWILPELQEKLQVTSSVKKPEERASSKAQTTPTLPTLTCTCKRALKKQTHMLYKIYNPSLMQVKLSLPSITL